MNQGLNRGAQYMIGFFRFVGDLLIDLFKWIGSWFWELLFIAAFLAVVIGVGVWFLGLVNASPPNDPCWRDQSSFDCKNQRVEQCLASELYTRDQCVILIGGGK